MPWEPVRRVRYYSKDGNACSRDVAHLELVEEYVPHPAERLPPEPNHQGEST